MWSSSNDGLFGEHVKKRPSPNGPNSLDCGLTPKCKVQRVLGARDFPPFCDKSAPKVYLSSEDNVIVSKTESMVDSEAAYGGNGPNTEIDFYSFEIADYLVDMEESEGLEKLVGNLLDDTARVIESGPKEQSSHARHCGFEFSKDLDNSEMPQLKEGESVPCNELVKEEVDEGSLIDNLGSVHKHHVQSPDCVTAGTIPICDGKRLSPSQYSFKNENVDVNISPSSVNKNSRRRVFAIRNFPPFCGINAPMPNRVVAFDKKVTENKVNVFSRHAIDTGTRMRLANGLPDLLSDVTVAGSQCSMIQKTTVVCKEDLKGVQDSNVGRGQHEETTVLAETLAKKENDHAGKAMPRESRLNVHGLMAESYCPWKPGKQSNLQRAGRENEIVAFQHESDQKKKAGYEFSSRDELVRPTVQGLMAKPYCPWRKGDQTSLDGVMRRNQLSKSIMYRQKSYSYSAAASIPKAQSHRQELGRMKPHFIGKAMEGPPEDSSIGWGQHESDLTRPLIGPNRSNCVDARGKVKETLRQFQSIFRKILQGEESKAGPGEVTPKISRIDLEAAKVMKSKGKGVNTGHQILGQVPGVEVGDAFQYRVELALVGVHRLYQAGIDSMNHGGMQVATSIVASGAYDDDLGDADELIYSGQGGNVVDQFKIPEDQKLVRGNLALKNSIAKRNPVRVIRGYKETKTSESDGRANLVTTYVYDGLYTVEHYWTEKGPHGNMVFKFKLVRMPGQPVLAWKEAKSSKKSKVQHGICVPDITEGKELLPVTAVNTIDGVKPPPFKYIKKMMYPSSFHPAPPNGCGCIGRCSDTKRCSCIAKNGGEIPYNHNGAIVEMKPLVFECGPSCKCPPSCYNRVTQHGIKIPLEVFKTDKRGWGVRALTSISSGTFICEYAGELLNDIEAEQRIGNDEYLFDIGRHNFGQADLNELEGEGHYTIDAAHFGNIGRFINHSCSPNLYAQNVVYDHKDKRMPHIMLFAAENIPPLKELSYHYNYSVGQVYDSDGNIKVKRCFCGSSYCTGRMY